MSKLIETLQKDITRKYIIALSIIAILSTLTFYTLHNVLEEFNNTGYIVNVSGKQRMLSQHIALDAYRVHYKVHHKLSDKTAHGYNNSIIIELLKSNAKEMLDANKMLSTGKLLYETKYTLSPTIKDMYFGEMNLAKRVEEYVDIANKIANHKENSNIENLIKQLDTYSEVLLKDLNKVVQQYQKEGEEKLSDMQGIETIAWIATIITLLLEIIFIFQPMVREIMSLKSENDSVMQHLEDTIEIRTMHLEKANDKLAHLAFHDPLTGLRNRLNLEKDVERAVYNYKQHNAGYAVLMFDVDWFKAVNDEYGHDVGDIVLKELSSILVSAVREEDKVYRAGGEEFVILLNRINYKDTSSIAQKIRVLIEKHVFKVENEEFSKTISCGLFHSSIVEAFDVKSVLKVADNALYKAKETGRNRVCDAIPLTC